MNSQPNIQHYLKPAKDMKRGQPEETEMMDGNRKSAKLDNVEPHDLVQGVGEDPVVQHNYEEMFDRLTDHLTQLTSNMEANLTAQIAASIREVVSQEISTAITNIRKEFNAEMKLMKTRLENLEARPVATKVINDVEDTIYVAGVAISEHENVLHKATAIIKDGCKVNNIEVRKADRRKGFNGKPGIVVVRLGNKDQVDKVMEGVKNLKQTSQYKKVFISRHMSKELRAMKSNARTLLKACGKEQDFVFKGAFLAKKPNTI